MCTHSYSPLFESKVPRCRLRSLSVKRGPSSCNLTTALFSAFFSRSSKIYRWCLQPPANFNSQSLMGISKTWMPQRSTCQTLTCCQCMAPEEDEVTLVVEGDSLAAPERGVLVEERGNHAAHTPAQHRVKILQDQLWLELPWPPMALQAKHSSVPAKVKV